MEILIWGCIRKKEIERKENERKRKRMREREMRDGVKALRNTHTHTPGLD